ncbi:CaiB/BaiF CoA transferase family protein [Glaciimonas immobilis]|uniref:Crotonobetainyl-CoA:carnitine CoA-transferase CaiB-like acyl-CoA transferase n=1 Tax=Glaciimonas immobilis TaxID=728004 RepID=A0A840RV62_9BURK|nr:CaiB/BaiF CoA-transferase family protein [Glaciimonas immobilis]KAF3996568.1 CoA transferase [Glaciimonas immobilis]MBB5201062.1 crotonobetainyl-CoA:carnitine CoA-transferase CaiB-like acyl-CoA transferase [Glaciimonas immobilis]
MKLDGLRVIDLSRFLPGPMLTQFMADHGAEVIKIESVDEGEPTRAVGEIRDGISVFFANTSRGKKSLALDLKQPAGREALMRLAEVSDVVIEAFRPGVADRLGVGYQHISVRAPHIVYASISAFGQSGPYRDLATHDLAIEAMAGVLSLNRGRDGAPAIPGLPAADMLASMVTLSGVMMALLRRKETGRGDFIDMAMADCLLAAIPNNLDTAMARRQQPDVREARSLGGNALYAIYDTKDGDWIALGGQEMKFAVNLLTALGRPDLIDLCRLPPGKGQAPVSDFLSASFRTKTKNEWVAYFKGRDIPFAPVQTLPEMLDDPHFRQRGAVITDARGWDHIGNPIRFTDEPGRMRFEPPALGQHSQAILQMLHYSELEIAQLKKDGTVKEATPEDILRHSGLAEMAPVTCGQKEPLA